MPVIAADIAQHTEVGLVSRASVFPEQAPRELALDAVLAFQQPVHGLVELADAGILDVEGTGQGRGVPPPCGGLLGVGPDDAPGDHGAHQVAPARGPRRDEVLQAECVEGAIIEMGEVGEGAFLDLAALALGPPQERGAIDLAALARGGAPVRAWPAACMLQRYRDVNPGLRPDSQCLEGQKCQTDPRTSV